MHMPVSRRGFLGRIAAMFALPTVVALKGKSVGASTSLALERGIASDVFGPQLGGWSGVMISPSIAESIRQESLRGEWAEVRERIKADHAWFSGTE